MNIPSMQDLLSAGVHFGHQIRRGHPRMGKYIFGARDGVHIIDLAASEEKLGEAAKVAFELGKNNGVMLVVGTKKQAKEIVKSLATAAGAPFLVERWIGGLLTNFDQIKGNVSRLNKLKEEQSKGELSRYTKKEQLLIARKLIKFELVMGGVSELEKVPDAVFVVDAVSDLTAVREVQKMGITLIGICDTNADPNWFDYPIPGNDDGIKSIKMICETVINSYAQGKSEFSKKEKAAETARIKENKDAEDKLKASELQSQVAEEAAAIEEEVEKAEVADSDRKP